MLTSAGEESYPDCHPLIDDWKAAGGPEFVSTDPYNPSRLKGQVFEGGIRVPLIVNGPPVATSMEGQVSDQLVDVVDLHETIREVSYIGGVYPGPLGFNDSQSFAWVLRGDPGPWGGLPKRDFSYSATFSPNTDFFTPSGDWMGETAREYWKDCVIRQNSTTAKWYKMIRTVAYDSGGTATVGHLLHELHFGSGIDPESCVLPSGHAEYIPMKNKLESVTGIRDIDF